MTRRGHMPQRRCVGCLAVRPKSDLLRLARTGQDEVVIDKRGKMSGRGAYICRRRACIEKAVEARRFERALGKRLDRTMVNELLEAGADRDEN